jgi:glycine/D-amino acid oxidase-like deaminating enzyme
MEETNGSHRAAAKRDVHARLVPDEVEVAVVGAGPTGLTAAAMLAGYGVQVVVLVCGAKCLQKWGNPHRSFAPAAFSRPGLMLPAAPPASGRSASSCATQYPSQPTCPSLLLRAPGSDRGRRRDQAR